MKITEAHCVRMIKTYIDRIVQKRIRQQGDSVILTRHSTYIVPTRYGVIFAIILSSLLLSAMNYGNSLLFLFTFLLVGITFLAMYYTYANIIALAISAGSNPAVYAGQQATFVMNINVLNQRQRYALYIDGQKNKLYIRQLDKKSSHSVSYQDGIYPRGQYKIPRIKISTTYPLGLFYAWSWVQLDHHIVVYPRPKALLKHLDLHGGQTTLNTDTHNRNEQDDFSGFRQYRPSDSPKQIAWKALASTDLLLSKIYSSTAANELWLDYDALDPLTKENRLSQLCQSILDCERVQCHYGLKLPGVRIPCGLGTHHQTQCLHALAMY